MPDIKAGEAWDWLEKQVAEFLSFPEGEVLEIDREGEQFFYAFDFRGHDFRVWVKNDSPRYCAQVDGVLGFRATNARGLLLVLKLLAENQETSYQGNEVWD